MPFKLENLDIYRPYHTVNKKSQNFEKVKLLGPKAGLHTTVCHSDVIVKM